MKILTRLTGILTTAALLLCSISLITHCAEINFEKNGAYVSDLLVWEQKHPGEGRLLIFGYPLRVDLERLRRLGEDSKNLVHELVSEFSEWLSEASDTLRSEIFGKIISTCLP